MIYFVEMKKLALLIIPSLFLMGCNEPTTNTNPRDGRVCDLGCTYTMGWYKNHEDWPVNPNTQLCGKTWEEWLDTQPNGDGWIVLAHQWITATMNVLNGAYADQEVQAALADAATIIYSCNANDKQEATALATVLDDFNNGLKSAPHCDDAEESGSGDGGGSGSGGDDGVDNDNDKH
jgi:hypothetical protein